MSDWFQCVLFVMFNVGKAVFSLTVEVEVQIEYLDTIILLNFHWNMIQTFFKNLYNWIF